MPLVHIDLLEGRSPEQLKKMCQDVTTAISQNLGAPKEHVHIVLNEMQHDHYAVGGVLKADEEQ
ncbi:4-oxalocrotonate tautomerase [Bombilactobacillus folatiphilus]|uniref:Tautomerase n=1 Tax=Bombilactobacillus folatiphilus TaxID=2923362 RepID=A0ABY4P7B4_9LACO|nr:2-hydroxymuconate tautomerase [Bombilactobacillus folatiphilus]UQS81510.1 4-oxalocrotonate tautomerase [Bombilactobacillus folatiphilus]